MSGLDKIRMPESKRWIASVIIGVATIMGLMLGASWWSGGPFWRFLVSLFVSVVVGYAIAFAFLKDRGPRLKPKKSRK